ncbi:Mannose-6-phosphate isomerase [Arthrobacter sp. SO3]|nr:Mannose-6-phosphate isomerase [Arthrobacter sp. SO3]
MFLPITNEPRNYEWGSLTAISGLLGRQASGSPEAELWLGDHPGSPAQILDPDLANGATTLDHWIAADPVTALGTDSGEARLGFLLKILAADAPLSLQAHPTREQAVTGFARENAAGIPLDAAHRNYKDVQHKPEVIYALSETFEALCGFRAVEDSLETLHSLGDDCVPQALEPLVVLLRSGLPAAVRWLLSASAEVLPAIKEVVAAAHADTALARSDAQLSTVRMLAVNYPDDPGILLSLLLHRVTLRRGEALYLPAGNIHAYLQGVGVEVMAASDKRAPRRIDTQTHRRPGTAGRTHIRPDSNSLPDAADRSRRNRIVRAGYPRFPPDPHTRGHSICSQA